MVWGAVLGAGLSAFSQQQANNANKKNLSKIQDLFKQQQLETDNLYGQAHQQLLKALMHGNQGYAQARKDVSMSGSGQRQAIVDMMKQNLAQNQQAAISGGFGNSSMLLNMQRGAGADTQRNMLNVDSGIAGQLGGMSVDQGQMQSALMQQMAQLFMAKANAKSGQGTNNMGILSGVQHVAGGSNDYSGLAKLFEMMGQQNQKKSGGTTEGNVTYY